MGKVVKNTYIEEWRNVKLVKNRGSWKSMFFEGVVKMVMSLYDLILGW